VPAVEVVAGDVAQLAPEPGQEEADEDAEQEAFHGGSLSLMTTPPMCQASGAWIWRGG